MSVESKYTGRVEELEGFCQLEYGMQGRDIRTLLLSLIPSDFPIWSCIETAYSSFWADLEAIQPVPRMVDACILSHRARYANPVIDTLLKTRRKPLVVKDHAASIPRHYPGVNHRAPFLLTELVRWQVPAGLMRVSRPGVKDELGRLVNLCIDPEHRPHLPIPVSASPAMSDLIKLVGTLNPDYQTNLHSLTYNLSLIPSANCCLLGRESLTDADWLTTLRGMQGCVREWTQRILAEFVEKDGAHRIDMLPETTKLPAKLVRAEVQRLSDAQVLSWKGGKHVWIERGEYWWMETAGLIGGTVRWWK